MAWGPRFDLGRVKVAVAVGNFVLGKTRAVLKIQEVVPELLRGRQFAQAVIASLIPGDFAQLVALEEGGEFDVYAVELSAAVLRAFNLEAQVATWYVKLQLFDGALDDEVFVLSMHLLEYRMKRVSGVLSPRRIRS